MTDKAEDRLDPFFEWITSHGLSVAVTVVFLAAATAVVAPDHDWASNPRDNSLTVAAEFTLE